MGSVSETELQAQLLAGGAFQDLSSLSPSSSSFSLVSCCFVESASHQLGSWQISLSTTRQHRFTSSGFAVPVCAPPARHPSLLQLATISMYRLLHWCSEGRCDAERTLK